MSAPGDRESWLVLGPLHAPLPIVGQLKRHQGQGSTW